MKNCENNCENNLKIDPTKFIMKDTRYVNLTHEAK